MVKKSNCFKSDCKCMHLLGVLAVAILIAILTSCDVYDQVGAKVYTLRGTVKDIGGNPVSDVTVWVDSDAKVITGNDGTFELRHVSDATVDVHAEKSGYFVIPAFDAERIVSNGNSINVDYSTDSDTVENCNFLITDKITIPIIQGTSDISPLNGEYVDGVVGVVTQVCFQQGHNNTDFNTPVPEENTEKRQIISDDGFYMQLLPNCEIQELRADNNSDTSDGIFVSTRDPYSTDDKYAWLDSCKLNGLYPKPGDIVKVSGQVIEFTKTDRFGESRGLKSRTQINAVSVERDNSIVPSGKIDLSDDNLLRLTYEDLGPSVDQDSFRTVPFNSKGIQALKTASEVFESCEGMLVRIMNPIVVGACYYNTTPVLADGGKKGGSYPDQFNEKWMANVVQKEDFNTEVIYTYYDSVVRFDPLPQIGTVLVDDSYDYTQAPDSPNNQNAKVFRGVMDYSDNGIYMIYPFREKNLSTNDYSTPRMYYDVSVNRHDKFKIGLNDEAPEESLYKLSSLPLAAYIRDNMSTAQENYKTKLSGSVNEHFSVPDSWTVPDNTMKVAVFNLENYIAEGARYKKYVDVANIFINNLRLPDLIFVVEMGDQDDSKETLDFANSNFSQTKMTGVVAARLNYETLINKIKKETGIQYDYRQIDPVEYTQAGSPGNNIRVGFMFRTDRIEAYDIGLDTVHLEGISDYTIPENLLDGHTSLVFPDGNEDTKTDFKPGKRDPEPKLTLETKKILAETQTEPTGIYDEDGNLKGVTLSQSPGFIQDGRFYNSRLPLICKFKFIPTGEDFFGIALHMYSKGRDDKLYGTIQPPVLTSEIRRSGQSVAVNEFINKILSIDPNAKIIVGGDVNDFGFTYPIRKLTGEEYGHQVLYSMPVTYMPENERFTYVFNGNLQELDHIFVSPSIYEGLKGKGGSPAGVADWQEHVFVPHVNSLFSRDIHIQVSDHDPIAARIDM